MIASYSEDWGMKTLVSKYHLPLKIPATPENGFQGWSRECKKVHTGPW
jgi:hypothetical protein